MSDSNIYILEDPFTGKQLKRAADKIKPFQCAEEVYMNLIEDDVSDEEVDEAPQELARDKRIRRPPERLIEHC